MFIFWLAMAMMFIYESLHCFFLMKKQYFAFNPKDRGIYYLNLQIQLLLLFRFLKLSNANKFNSKFLARIDALFQR